MALAYRIEIAAPVTRTSQAKTWVFSPDSDAAAAIVSLDVELKKDKRRLSVATAQIADPTWQTQPRKSLFNALPDPAFWDVPLRIYLAPPGAPRSPTHLVFEGKVTALQPSFPGPTILTIVAHDRSVDARRNARIRTFRNKSSVQIAEAIAKEYGYTVDLNAGTVSPKQRLSDFGLGGSLAGGKLSDWDHLSRALHADGLDVRVEGSRLIIRQVPTKNYAFTIAHGDERVLTLAPNIQHVGTPGGGGNVKTPIAFEGQGTYQALSGLQGSIQSAAGAAAAGAAIGSSLRTHRNRVGGPATSQTGTHLEDVPKTWSNEATQLRRRKDTCSLTALMMPDFTLDHVLNLDGWGGKVDGAWYPESIRHRLIGGGADGMTTISLHRAASKAGVSSVGGVWGA